MVCFNISSIIFFFQTFRSILTSPFVKRESYKNEWTQLLQSALATILELNKEGIARCDNYIQSHEARNNTKKWTRAWFGAEY